MEIKIKVLNAMRLTKLLIAASRWLSRHADILNDLNVYPVPDGDTGTNMSMTLQAVENDLMKVSYELSMKELSDIVSEAVLLGARGNSGTILSQIIQGFLDGVRIKEEVTVEDTIKAFGLAKEKAYQAVSDPVEGTMLTVIRKVAEGAKTYKGDRENFVPFLIHLKNVAGEAVEETPKLLSKLREAGVVDAGGKGIFYILEGFEKSITDSKMLEDLERIVQSQAKRHERLEANSVRMEKIKFKYCTEFIIENGDFDLEGYKAKISKNGDSMVCAQTSKKTKTHIHTNNPGIVLEIAGSLGNLSNIKIDNMELQQHKNLMFDEESYVNKQETQKIVVKNENSRPVGYFAIVDNREIGDLFLNSGATAILLGGQTQNPSVADIEEGLKKIEAENIVILPNNKNIISAARIAAERSEKNVTVFGVSSMLAGHYIVKNRDLAMEKVVKSLNTNFSIEITKAVRKTTVDNMQIQEGDFIAIVNGKITEKSSLLKELVQKITKKYVVEDTLNIFVSIGKNAEEEATTILRNLSKEKVYEDIEGNQENYPYYIYIENKNPNLAEIAIVTDSTSDLTPEFIKDLDIEIVPLKIKLDGNNYYRENVDITKRQFWKKILVEGQLPKTSQPSPAEFKSMYEKLFAKGYKKIISIHISGKLSGTQQAARVAKGMTDRGDDIIIIDSKTATFALGYLVTEAAKLAKQRKPLIEIIENIEDTKESMRVYFVVKDLEFLQKGGRIGRTSAVLGGILKLKPVLKLENGEISVEAKAIGERGAMLHLEKILKASKNSIILCTAWGGTQAELSNADTLRNTAEKMKKVDYVGRFEIGATLGSHTGAVYGMGVMDKIR